MKKISQMEARRLRRRVKELELASIRLTSRMGGEWPSGVQIGTYRSDAEAAVVVAIRTARRLGHAVACTEDGRGSVYFYALPL